MKYVTKLKLTAIHVYCDEEDKSTEFMIQYMIDACKVSHDTVINYLALGEKEHNNLRKDLFSLMEFFAQFDLEGE